jgi:hypothetical protein
MKTAQSLFMHTKEFRHISINVVIDSNFLLSRVLPMKPARVLHNRSFPRKRHGQYQCIKS